MSLKSIKPEQWPERFYAGKAVVLFPNGIESGSWYSKPQERGETTCEYVRADLAALPARGVGAKPQDVLNDAWRDDLGEEGLAMYARILAALSPAAQPGADVAAQARESALAVLAGLSSYLGAGLGDDDTTPEQYDKRIRWAIDDLTARTRQAALREAAAVAEKLAATSEDDRYWGVDARRQVEQEAAKNIALNILDLIGKPRT